VSIFVSLGQYARKWDQDKQSDNRNYNEHDHNCRIGEVLATDDERCGNIALRPT
jgi:hypothetical protein